MYKNKRSVPLFKRVHGALFDFRPTMRLLAVPVGGRLRPADPLGKPSEGGKREQKDVVVLGTAEN